MPNRGTKKKLVQFLVGYQGYNAGERATFSPARAQELIAGGVAAEPGVIAKMAAAAKAAKAAKTTRGVPEAGKKASFFVDGLGDVTGIIVEVPAEGPIKIIVGQGDDADHYEVGADELVVLE